MKGVTNNECEECFPLGGRVVSFIIIVSLPFGASWVPDEKPTKECHEKHSGPTGKHPNHTEHHDIILRELVVLNACMRC